MRLHEKGCSCSSVGLLAILLFIIPPTHPCTQIISASLTSHYTLPTYITEAHHHHHQPAPLTYECGLWLEDEGVCG